MAVSAQEPSLKELRERIGLTKFQAGAMTGVGVLYAQLEDEAHNVNRLKKTRKIIREIFNGILERRKNYEDSREIL